MAKVHMIECWATWCGPCKAVIPHVNELNKKFADKGLVIIGMNVWEDGKDKVADFVKAKGDGMSYNVAYVGRGGAFEQQWLKAAGVRGIPHTFLVKDGKLQFHVHPAEINDEIITGLLAGGGAQEKVLEQFKNRDKINALMRDFAKAEKAKDTQAMAETIKQMEEAAPKAPYLNAMKLDLAMATKQWDQATELAGELADAPNAERIFPSLALQTLRRATLASSDSPAAKEVEQFPETLRKAIAAGFAKSLGDEAGDPTLRVVEAALYVDIGDLDAAKAAAKQAADNPGRYPVEPFAAYLKSLEDGQPQKYTEFFAALRQTMQQKAKEKSAH